MSGYPAKVALVSPKGTKFASTLTVKEFEQVMALLTQLLADDHLRSKPPAGENTQATKGSDT